MCSVGEMFWEKFVLKNALDFSTLAEPKGMYCVRALGIENESVGVTFALIVLMLVDVKKNMSVAYRGL